MYSLLIATLLTLPFEDPQGRFVVDLPEGWSTSASDAGGVTFTKNRQAVFAVCSVRVIPLGQTGAQGYIKTLEQSAQNQPGFKVMAKGADKLGGTKAWRWRYVASIDQTGKLQKIVDERVITANGVAYMMHLETVAQAFESFVPEFSQLINSFNYPRPEEQVSPVAVPNYVLVGSWRSETDAAMRLTFYADNRVLFGAFSGVYRIDGNQILIKLTNRDTQQYFWQLVGGQLTLVSPQLPAPLRYRRVSIGD